MNGRTLRGKTKCRLSHSATKQLHWEDDKLVYVFFPKLLFRDSDCLNKTFDFHVKSATDARKVVARETPPGRRRIN